MYLAFPPPDDEQQTLALEAFHTRLKETVDREPARFAMPVRHKARRRQPVRRESQNPLRLVPRWTKRAATAAIPSRTPDDSREPERILREALAEARKRGLTLEALAERAGLSGRTLRRRLKTPETMPLGDYCRIVRAAGAADPEGER